MGWDCVACDGHDVRQLSETLEKLRNSERAAPHLLHAVTVKGRGVDYLEGRTESHFPPPLTAAELALVRYSIERRLA
jgi:transketolase